MRKLGIVSAIVVGVLIVLIIALYFSLNAIARYALHKAGTSILGVETTASSVDLGVFRRSTVITDLVIDNPPGFNRPHMMVVKEMYIEGRAGTFASSDIEIPLVRLTGFTFDLEQIKGKINVSEVVDHITKQVGTDDDSSDQVTLNIKRLEILDIDLTAEGKIVNVTGGKLNAKLPKIVLADVGTESDGDKLLGHIVGVMMDIVVKHIAANPIKGLSNLAISQISNSISSIPGLKQTGLGRPIADAVDVLGKGTSGAISGVGTAIHGLGHAITGKSGESSKNANKQADNSNKQAPAKNKEPPAKNKQPPDKSKQSSDKSK